MVLCISHVHPMLIKSIGCVKGAFRAFLLKTSAALNDVKL